MKLTIGKLAKASDVGVETIRFYEKKELIVRPEKVGGFRYYSEELIHRIKFIKRSQQLGFTLKETKELLDLSLEEKSQWQDVLSRTESKISEIENKIKDLQRMKNSLLSLASCCEDSTIALSDCPVLDCFMDEGKRGCSE